MRLARIILFSLARAVASSKDSPRAALLKLAGQVDDAPARGGDDEFADAARADASAPAKDSPESPPRRSLLSYLTGRREDAAGAPADDGSPKQNNTSARLMFDFTKDYFDDLSLFLSLANETKLRESEKAVTAICFPSPAKPAADDPPDEITALLRRLGLEERVGPIFAREQIEEESLPFITIEDLVEVGVSSVDAQTIVAAVTPDAEPTAVATEPAAAFKEAPAAEIPERLCCPISMDIIMAQPVLAADGHTYDRSSIEDWLSRGNTTSPTTGAPLEHLALAPNHLVKSMVAENKDSVASR